MKKATWIISLTSLLLSACAGILSDNDSRLDLEVGVKSFEEGDMATATLVLQHALDDGLATKNDKVTAHKYLAFIHCLADEVIQCRSEFKKALEISPLFKLKPSEAGHPKWGPVFSEEKARFAK